MGMENATVQRNKSLWTTSKHYSLLGARLVASSVPARAMLWVAVMELATRKTTTAPVLKSMSVLRSLHCVHQKVLVCWTAKGDSLRLDLVWAGPVNVRLIKLHLAGRRNTKC